MRRAFLLSLPLLCLSFASLPAADWPEFRGPTAQGLATGKLPTSWGPDRHVAWSQPIPGSGWSSPIVVQNRIYLTTSLSENDGPNKDLSLRTLCLDAASGKILWNTEVFRHNADKAPRIHGKNSQASPTPVWHNDRLYVHFGHLGTACLDAQGKVLWHNRELTYAPVHGNGGSPAVVEDLLVFSIDGADKQALVALDCATGKLRWETDRRSQASKKFSFATPLLIEVNGRREIISQASDVVVACDPKTGRELWRVRYSGYSVIPRPVYAHGLLFISTSYDAPMFLAIRPGGEGDVTDTHVVWQTKRNAPHTPSPLVMGEELYLVSDRGMATCLDAKTGKVHWEERLNGNYSASPLGADGKIYFQSEEGIGTVVKASPKFTVLSRNDMKERTLASYAAMDGAIILRTATKLYRIQE